MTTDTARAVAPNPLSEPPHPLAALLTSPGAAHRRALARAITLIESSLAQDRLAADHLLHSVLMHSGKALRIGISGVPGAGKSTLIEALGLYLTQDGQRVAVLAVDPSSPISGGSIMGDKTRMERLSQQPLAFIRPSPSGGTLGGVAAQTRETALLCEAAGYGIILIETVGTGQSEIAVHSMCDVFVLLQLPNAGDELQAMKKGIMELADVVAINKADLDPLAATRARNVIANTLQANASLSVAERVLSLSASTSEGIETFWQTLQRFVAAQQASGRFMQRRQQQNQQWLWQTIERALKTRFLEHPQVQAQLPSTLAAIDAGQLDPSAAARQLLAATQSTA